MKIFEIVGRKIINFFREFGQIALLLVSVFRYIPRVIKDRKLVLEQMAVVGADSLPLVILIGSFTGAIAAIQATSLFSKFNILTLAQGFIGSSIATVVFTELTPVLTALVIAGRVGGAMAAQIGTMTVSEQIDALDMMAIDRNRYLVMPRVFASLVMMLILAVFSSVVALAGGFFITQLKYEFSFYSFFDSVVKFFQLQEVIIGMSKSVIYGGVTALIGCHVGLRTTGGAEGVGNSTVRAYTISAATILIIDAMFGAIF
jgi:phospholipid/cholesterol/gamma-HCH transport system permease protein